MSTRPVSLSLLFSALLVVALPMMACASSSQLEEPPRTETDETAGERPNPDFSEPPDNFTDADVIGVVEGPAVLLRSDGREAILPIFINPSQAMAIQLGIEGQDFERPLTHDLVEDMIDRLDGEIAKVHVDDLRGGTFIATSSLVTPTQVVEVDARPSDAIALSVGRDIPIYVADRVMDEGGLTDDELDQMQPAEPGDPEDFDDSPTTPL